MDGLMVWVVLAAVAVGGYLVYKYVTKDVDPEVYDDEDVE